MDTTDWQARTKMILNDHELAKLDASHVLIAGLGGVGAYAAEQLVRAGVGEVTIADSDVFQQSNVNRQLMALQSTIGKRKTEVYSSRFRDINPQIKIHEINTYLTDDEIVKLLKNKFTYVVDAIDTLSPKISMIMHTLSAGYPLVSSMGAGGRIDPLQVHLDNFWNTRNCRLAYYIRKILRRNGITDTFKAVYSTELVNKEYLSETTTEKNKKAINGTVSYLPPVFGCICASAVIREIAERTFHQP